MLSAAWSTARVNSSRVISRTAGGAEGCATGGDVTAEAGLEPLPLSLPFFLFFLLLGYGGHGGDTAGMVVMFGIVLFGKAAFNYATRRRGMHDFAVADVEADMAHFAFSAVGVEKYEVAGLESFGFYVGAEVALLAGGARNGNAQGVAVDALEEAGAVGARTGLPP